MKQDTFMITMEIWWYNHLVRSEYRLFKFQKVRRVQSSQVKGLDSINYLYFRTQVYCNNILPLTITFLLYSSLSLSLLFQFLFLFPVLFLYILFSLLSRSRFTLCSWNISTNLSSLSALAFHVVRRNTRENRTPSRGVNTAWITNIGKLGLFFATIVWILNIVLINMKKW